MWIEELSNGRYKYIERYTDPYTGKYKRVSITLDRNTRQAEKQAQRELQAKIDSLLNRADTHDMTYGELLDEYLNQWLPTVKDSTKRNNLRFDRYIAESLPPDTLLNKIDKRLIRQFINQNQEKYNYPTLSRVRKRLHAVLDYAVSMDYIQNNPSDKILVPKPAEKEMTDKVDFLTMAEITELIGQMKDNQDWSLIPIVKLLSLTGMRYGELAALTADKIDFEQKTILINETYDFNSHKLTTTKTKGSTRKISVSDNILDILRDCQVVSKSNFLFASFNGNPLSNAFVNRRLKNYQPEKKLRTHIFRHSHISYLAEQGIPLKAIMDRVGHSDPKTTLAIYSHTTLNMQETINQRVNELQF